MWTLAQFRRELSQTPSSGGRPRHVITRRHIETLRNTGVQWTAIARCLGVSAKTLYRRRLEYGLQDSFSDITNEELEWNIRDILKLTPFSGESYIWGALRGRGIFIQRWKIREVLQTVDHVGCAIRRRSSIDRRLYNVQKPTTCGTWTPTTSSFIGDLFSMAVLMDVAELLLFEMLYQ